MAKKAGKYFTFAEFDSPDQPGSGKIIDPRLVKVLDLMRADCGFPFVIASGVRTPEHNAEVGGVGSSAHVYGEAADIVCRSSYQRMAIIQAALKHNVHRIGIGDTFIHVDVSKTLPQGVIWTY